MLAETAIAETDLDRLSRRESRAHEYIDDAIKSWIAYVDEINAIHSEGDWRAKAPTWKAYLEAEFLPKLSYGYDRLYQLQAAQPFASAIEQTTGILLNERQTRLVKSLGYEAASPIAAELIVRAHELAEYRGESLKPNHIKDAHTVIKEHRTSGTISLEGESLPTDKPLDLIQLAIVQESDEHRKRQRQHMQDASKRQPIECTPELMLVDGKKYAVFPSEIPLESVIGKKLKFYVEAA
jgi:hypothetical protein